MEQRSIYILGLFCNFHDSSACLLRNGKLVAMAEEERFNRKKHSSSFPENAIKYCLEIEGVSISDVSKIAYGFSPGEFLKFQMSNAISNFPTSLNLLRKGGSYEPFTKKMKNLFGLSSLVKNKIGPTDAELIFVPHHDAHAFSTYYPSAFDDSAIMVIDGFGETESTTFYSASQNMLEKIGQVKLPHSMGVFYGTITQLLGFRPHSDEYKVMGMAAYGKDSFKEQFKKIIWKDEKLSFKLDEKYFRLYTHGVREWFSPELAKLLIEPREYGSELHQVHFDIAHSAQKCLEEIVLSMAIDLKNETQLDNLCISGGVGQNVLMNHRIANESGFDNVFVPPFCYDGGISLGAALSVHAKSFNGARNFSLSRADWGPSFSDKEVIEALNEHNLNILEPDDFNKDLSELIADGLVIGYFQGRMEVGPRALGFRSILADPRNPDIKDILNSRVKRREFFRPFAPVVLKEYCSEYFDLINESPFMTTVGSVTQPDLLPGITHLDGTARVQTVTEENNENLCKLLTAFKDLTGIPVLINTSFNENEPIVCTPKEAIDCFMRTKIDVLALNNKYIVTK